MARKITVFFVLLFSALIAFAGYYYVALKAPRVATKQTVAQNNIYKNSKRFKAVAPPLIKYATTNNFSKQYLFLIDMHIASGSNRFFVYDIAGDSIVAAGLVTHGRCNSNWLVGRKYGNKIGCGCTSLGKYKIGNSYNGRFGKAFKLYGLDSSNSNAFSRYVVLHSHECVPENEIDPYPICQSDGCPTVSPQFLKTLSAFIEKANAPILMCIYDQIIE